MATSLQTLIPLLSSLALLLTLANAAQSLSKKTSFAYNFTTGGAPPTDLTYQGDAHFPVDTKVLRLTNTDDAGNAQPWSVGRVLYTKPVIFSDRGRQATFQTNLQFIIKPNKGDTGLPADGLVFFIAPVNSPIGDAGGSFGVFDESGINPTVFAVEFDAFVNDEFDPSYLHVGVDFKSQVSSNVTKVGPTLVGKTVTAQISYDASTSLIRVRGLAGGKGFLLSYVYDLSSYLPQQVQVGISAATGGAVAVHDLISWSFTSNIVHVK